MRNTKISVTFICVIMSLFIKAQNNDIKEQGFVHGMSKDYVWPTDHTVIKKLDEWRDLKFGVMFHWGLYSVPGISESWPLCSEEKFILRRNKIRENTSYEDFKKWYWGLKDSFNPVQFNPGLWAGIMKDAGTKYMVFTTKHHDGFCMFDSKETDFSIAKGPFKNNPMKDVTYHVFDAFRQRGFMIGAYFSKPDWHNEYYWSPYLATPDRNVNYSVALHPEWWEKYRQFTSNQINELMTRYGAVDILWLDGGWVAAPKQDISMDKIVDDARKSQEGLIVVDRTIGGKNENYLTPELRIPEKQLNYPWESCITLTNRWGWSNNAPHKSAAKIINILTEITAKGGSLLLGVGPTGEGTIEEEAITQLTKIGNWLKVNGKSIYETRTTPDYNCGNVWFTADKDGKTLYAIYSLPEGGVLPESIEWEGNVPSGEMTLLKNSTKVSYHCKNNKVIVKLPKGLDNEAIAFRFKLKINESNTQ